jgi:hypothetical protein
MNIKLQAKISGLSDADLADGCELLEEIDDACSILAFRLKSQIVNRVIERDEYLDRLIRFCHTGK